MCQAIERTDVHAPSKLIPADYEYVCQAYVKIEGLGDCQFLIEQRAICQAHMQKTGGTYANHLHGGNCMVCGNVKALYTVLFYHAKTNTYVRVGQECAYAIDQAAAEGLNKLRKLVADVREAQRGIKKAQAILADAGLTAAWDVYKASGQCSREEGIIRDIVGKLVRYGSISPNQTAFIGKLLETIANKPAIEAARKAEQDAATPCPEGRITVTGEILTVRVDDTIYGRQTKMLVRANEGFKVWSTMPAGTHGDRGDKIVFVANVTPSPNDNKFGFAKRPKLVSVEHIQEGYQHANGR